LRTSKIVIAFDDGPVASEVIKVSLSPNPIPTSNYRYDTESGLYIDTKLLTLPTDLINPYDFDLYFTVLSNRKIEGDSYEYALQAMLVGVKLPFVISAAVTHGVPDPVGMHGHKLSNNNPILVLTNSGWKHNS